MVLTVRSSKKPLDDSTRRFLERRLVAHLERFYDRPDAELAVELIERETPHRDLKPQCKLTLFMPGAPTQRIEQSGANLREAIDLASDRLERVVKDELEWLRKRNPHHYRTRQRTAVRVPDSALPWNVKYYP